MSSPETSTAAVFLDRISNLSDDILIHIISSLPTKQAFLTSILSKRWKNLWCYVPDVEFIEAKHSGSKESFDEFVYYILRSRETAGNHSMHSFIMDVEHESSRLYDLVVGESPELPYTILTCTTLVVLKLNFINMGENFSPFHVTLPSLKTLHLTNITFEQDDGLLNLIEGCPILEDLHLFEVFDGSYVGWNWTTLTMLNRADVTECHISLVAISNVEFLRIRLSRSCEDSYLPTFHNLTHLVLNYDWDIVAKMLFHCPKLRNLDLYQIIPDSFHGHDCFGQYMHETWAHPKFVPGCLSKLKTCTMRDFAFGGLESYHIMLAKFILKNSPVLDTMSIWCTRKWSKIKRRLTSCSRASATCQLSIY